MNIAALVSGGVDSAVVVHRLKERGEDPTLFYIRIGMEGDGGDCSFEEDIEIVTWLSHKYGCRFEEVSLHKEYWEHVIEYTIDSVKRGLTPNPDMMCNKLIKFGFFEKYWGKDFDKIATGHYANTTIGPDNRIYLSTAADKQKDQTYFLGQINALQVSKLLFPIGDLQKSEVRQIAIEAKLPNARRRDSQGICFLGKINYNDFIKRYLGEKKGAIIELETGRKIGEHNGFWFHTIGQRKGLGLSGGPWYVTGKNTDENIIYVSNGYETEKQYGKVLPLDGMHFISGTPWNEHDYPVEVAFKNRHTPEFSLGPLSRHELTGAYSLHSESPIQGIAPGQFAVIYDREQRLCLGSGVITTER